MTKVLRNVFGICAILPLVCMCMDQKTNSEVRNKNSRPPKFVSIFKNYTRKNSNSLPPISLTPKRCFENSVLKENNEELCLCSQQQPELEELCTFLNEINGSIVTYNESLLLAIEYGVFKKVGNAPIFKKPIYAAPSDILLKMFPSFKKYIVAFKLGKIYEIPFEAEDSIGSYLYQKRVFLNPIYASIVKVLLQEKYLDYEYDRDAIFNSFIKGLDSSQGGIDIGAIYTAITYRDYVLIRAE